MDRTDKVSNHTYGKAIFEVVDRTDEVYSKAKLTWFEEIFKEYKLYFYNLNLVFTE
ncbi:hypothetical protein [Streptococcus pneumoniae]|uniref:hypothetical protein n=1 Tax=Streptococcus pneumoniae TaxID=1313 RepID=UPI001780D01C|nr:hypothetical protein [Streptococcus pneumoniae]